MIYIALKTQHERSFKFCVDNKHIFGIILKEILIKISFKARLFKMIGK